VVIGIGQSMGGALTIVQQGRYHGYDGVASLGYGAVRTHPPAMPGSTAPVVPWKAWDAVPGTPAIVLNQAVYDAAPAPWEAFAAQLRWHFFYDDEEGRCGPPLASLADDGLDRPWLAQEFPGGVVDRVMTPGVVAGEAAAITTPVLVALGERDTTPDPAGEPRAYLSAPSVDLFVCPRAGHMHNFAETRELMWERIATWADWVRAWRSSSRSDDVLRDKPLDLGVAQTQ
jgi:pimeloyl-ACP methyl ester carboxylesterase